MEESFACITQQKTKERLSKARCVSIQGKNIMSSKKQLHPTAGERQAAGRRLSGASCRLSPNMQDFRFRRRLPFNMVDTSSIIL